MKISFAFSVVLLLLCLQSIAQKSEIFTHDSYAISGYDAVSFHTVGEAEKGSDRYAFTWKSAIWLFANPSNLDKFMQNPEKYAPQYGGYCAYGTADGHKAPTQVETWTIDEGKLYFNYNMKVKNLWDKDRPGYIEKANNNWPKIKDSE